MLCFKRLNRPVFLLLPAVLATFSLQVHAGQSVCMSASKEIYNFISSGRPGPGAGGWVKESMDALQKCLFQGNSVCIYGDKDGESVLWSSNAVNDGLEKDYGSDDAVIEVGLVEYKDTKQGTICAVGQPSYGTDAQWIMSAWTLERGHAKQVYFGPFIDADLITAKDFKFAMLNRVLTIK